MWGHRCRGWYSCCAICGVCYAMHQSMWKGFRDVWRSAEFSTQGHTLTDIGSLYDLPPGPRFKGLSVDLNNPV